MNCKTCGKPVELWQKFVSGFEGDPKKLYLQHADCAGIHPQQAKTMSQLRLDSLAFYMKILGDQTPKV